jgi:hypothetical protein
MDPRRLEMTVLMTPDMANFSGKVHGGALLAFVDPQHLRIQHDRVRRKGSHGVLQRRMQVGAMDLEIRRAMPLLVLLAERQPVQQLTRIEAPELEGLGPHASRLDARSQGGRSSPPAAARHCSSAAGSS